MSTDSSSLRPASRGAVLVTDGHLRSSLAAVRALGRAGHRVYVCSPRRRSLAGASRWCLAETRVPSPLTTPDAFVDGVAALAQGWGVDTLLPMSEEALLAVLPARGRFAGISIPFPSLDVFRRAADKRYVTDVAAGLGMAVPSQVVVESRDDVARLQPSGLRLPLVVKPARSVAAGPGTSTKVSVSYADDPRELQDVLSALPPAAFPVLLQQRIRGHGTGVFLLMWDSRVLAQFAHRRIREKPPSGGVSVCCESIAADGETVRQSAALLAALDWQGPAMVEFKQDERTGVRYLMEINGRFWGSLQLAIDAGVDFPSLLVAAALGDRPSPVTTYRCGVRSRWWWGEVDHLIARLRHNEQFQLGGRWRAVREFVAPGRHVRNEVLRPDDPWPFVRETMDWLQRR